MALIVAAAASGVSANASAVRLHAYPMSPDPQPQAEALARSVRPLTVGSAKRNFRQHFDRQIGDGNTDEIVGKNFSDLRVNHPAGLQARLRLLRLAPR